MYTYQKTRKPHCCKVCGGQKTGVSANRHQQGFAGMKSGKNGIGLANWLWARLCKGGKTG
jgi:hypothetical protein